METCSGFSDSLFTLGNKFFYKEFCVKFLFVYCMRLQDTIYEFTSHIILFYFYEQITVSFCLAFHKFHVTSHFIKPFACELLTISIYLFYIINYLSKPFACELLIISVYLFYVINYFF